MRAGSGAKRFAALLFQGFRVTTPAAARAGNP